MACVVYCFSESILQFIVKPIGKVVFTYPSEAFLARMSLTIWGGLILSCPFILLQIWQFVAEALTEKEKKLVLFFGPISIGLFFVGIAFGYFVMIPTSMQFFELPTQVLFLDNFWQCLRESYARFQVLQPQQSAPRIKNVSGSFSLIG
jgi:Sec-independent protein secretion pathway component TatC